MSTRLLAGRYELIEKIGEGGMAIVYKARCRLLNRYVAIKILRPEFTKDEQFIENFKRESQAAAAHYHRARHPEGRIRRHLGRGDRLRRPRERGAG